MLTISGAYGRDYKSKKDIVADLAAGKDFVIRTLGPDDGRYCNLPDLLAQGHKIVNVRYKADRSVAPINLEKL